MPESLRLSFWDRLILLSGMSSDPAVLSQTARSPSFKGWITPGFPLPSVPSAHLGRWRAVRSSQCPGEGPGSSLWSWWIRSGIDTEAGLLGHRAILSVIFLRNLHAAFHRGYPDFRSHQQSTKAPLSASSPAPGLRQGAATPGGVVLTWVAFPWWLVKMRVSPCTCRPGTE